MTGNFIIFKLPNMCQDMKMVSKFVAPKEAACTKVGGEVKLSSCVYADQEVQFHFGSHFSIKLQLRFHVCRRPLTQREEFLRLELLPTMSSVCRMYKTLPFESIKYLKQEHCDLLTTIMCFICCL